MYCWYDGKSGRYGGLMQFFRVNTSHVCANGRHKPRFWKISTTIVLDKGENCYDQGWDDIGGGLETFRFTLRNWQIILKPFDRSFLFQIWYSPVKRRFWRPLSLKIYKSYNSLFFFLFLTEVSSLPVQSFSTYGNALIREPKQVACENRCFPSLIASSGGERGETAVFARYKPSKYPIMEQIWSDMTRGLCSCSFCMTVRHAGLVLAPGQAKAILSSPVGLI